MLVFDISLAGGQSLKWMTINGIGVKCPCVRYMYFDTCFHLLYIVSRLLYSLFYRIKKRYNDTVFGSARLSMHMTTVHLKLHTL